MQSLRKALIVLCVLARAICFADEREKSVEMTLVRDGGIAGGRKSIEIRDDGTYAVTLEIGGTSHPREGKLSGMIGRAATAI